MAQPSAPKTVKSFAVLATFAGLMLGACAQDGDSLKTALLDQSDGAKSSKASAQPQTELEKATEYWGKKYKEKPTDLEAALSYAKNLKALGERQQALAVIQQAAIYHGQDKQLASEYGRLALELDQLSVAKQMLAMADDPTSPDWRVISARGTVLAKEGKFRDSIPMYERALTLSQDQTSVMNNLAMAYAMNGEADKAEAMLRRIEAKGGTAKTRQNLALVLGLQGKFDEAKTVTAADLGAEGAAQNSDYMKRMVKVDHSADWNTSSTGTSKSIPRAGKAVATGPAPATQAAADETPSAYKAIATDDGLPLKGMR
jgi:Flp pilus assembly protein TadD